MSDTVKLVRNANEHPDSHEATVDAADVAGWVEAGWRVADPLDHDGDGKKGGRKKAKQPEAAADPEKTAEHPASADAPVVEGGETETPASDA